MELRLQDAMPRVARELEELLLRSEDLHLASQVSDLKIVDRCGCHDDFCATFYTQPKPRGGFGPEHDSCDIDAEQGMIIIHTVAGIIAKVEVLDRDDIRRELLAVIP